MRRASTPSKYPNSFGSIMEGRSYEGDTSFGYRFGFNTQEKDDEIYGAGNITTAEFWEYDSRLGRRWNTDPKPQTGLSRYSCLSNNPIMNNDPKGDVVGAAIVGFFKGLFAKKENWETGANSRIGNAFRRSGRNITNSAKIWGGLFISDKEKSFGGRVLEVLSRFTQQLPQTLVGLGYNLLSNTFRNVKSVKYFHGATAVEGAGFRGSVTLGSYISLESSNMDPETKVGIGAGSYTFMHEYGHYLQSQKLGWSYLIKIGIPSILGFSWTEHDANQRASNYFEKTDPNFHWDEQYYDTSEWEYMDKYQYIPGYVIDDPDIWQIFEIRKPTRVSK